MSENNNHHLHSTSTTSSLFKGKSLQLQPLRLGSLLPPRPSRVPSHSQMYCAGQWKHKSKSDPESSKGVFSERRRPYLLQNGKSSQRWRESNRECSQAAGSALRLGSGQPVPRVSAPFCHTICQALESFMLRSKLTVIYLEAQNSRSYLDVIR